MAKRMGCDAHGPGRDAHVQARSTVYVRWHRFCMKERQAFGEPWKGGHCGITSHGVRMMTTELAAADSERETVQTRGLEGMFWL